MTDIQIQKIREQIQKFYDIRWGWDGDCGSKDIIENIEEIIDEIEGK